MILLESDGSGGPGFESNSDESFAASPASSASSFRDDFSSAWTIGAFLTSMWSPGSPSAAKDHGTMNGSIDHSSSGTDKRLGYEVAIMKDAKSGSTPPPRGPSARRYSVPTAAPMASPLRLQNAFAVLTTAVFTFLVLAPMARVPLTETFFFFSPPPPPLDVARSSSGWYVGPVAPPAPASVLGDFFSDLRLARDATLVNVVTKA